MGKALYRRYRPTKLEDVVGQDQIVKSLSESLKSHNFSHAYLFTGPRGCGKTSVARIFAHEVNGFEYKIEDNYPDIVEIDAASNTGVDNIRDLIEKTIISPAQGKYKVYIIDEVHMLSKSAFNALLKTLEEPPKHVIFILATTDAYKVPITVTSRSQVFNFQLATPNVMLKHLQTISVQEKISISDEALELIVKKGGGSFRDSISLLDQISCLSDKGNITAEIVRDAFGIPDIEVIDALLSAYKIGNYSQVTELLQNYLNFGGKPEQLTKSLIDQIIINPEPEFLPLLSRLPEVKDSFPEAKLLLAFLSDISFSPRKKLVSQDQNSISNNKPLVKKSVESKQPSIPEENLTNVPTSDLEQQIHTNQGSGTISSSEFAWDNYLSSISKENATLANTLGKCTYKYDNSQLTIITGKKFQKTILESDKNFAILKKQIPEGIKLLIIDTHSISIDQNKNIGKISDIMGEIEEVKSDGVPF